MRSMKRLPHIPPELRAIWWGRYACVKLSDYVWIVTKTILRRKKSDTKRNLERN